ncbi:hypothetical protein F5887DRAFT_494271 [Amanita rubescens]|nr:hypothetical protein F5887DRAFT_494271 [Amanita rubescens]
MTSYVEITLWGGLPAPKKEAVEVVDTFLLHPSLSIMAADIPAQTFFDVLSRCPTPDHLWDTIDCNYRPSRHPDGNVIRRYYDPTEYHITEIAIFKRRFIIQNEGFIFRVHHQPADHTLPTEPDFLVTVDRGSYLAPARQSFSFAELAIDRVGCSLVQPTAPGPLKGTFRSPIVWRMPGPQPNYGFNLNLLQVGIVLEAIRMWRSSPEYHAIRKNCFWHSRIIRTVIRNVIQAQQPAGSNVIVAAHEPKVFLATLGNCFGIRLDDVDQEELNTIDDVYTRLYKQLTGQA